MTISGSANDSVMPISEWLAYAAGTEVKRSEEKVNTAAVDDPYQLSLCSRGEWGWWIYLVVVVVAAAAARLELPRCHMAFQ